MKTLWLAAALTLQAQAPPAALTDHLRAIPVLHADFVQTRKLAALSRPLKSTGRLVVSRDQGVIWRMVKPLPLTVVINGKGILEVGADGKRAVQSSKDVPMVARMAGIVKALLEGDWRGLDGLFSAQATGGPETGWTLALAPRPAVAAFLREVRIKGGRFVETIRVVEASGDTLEIQFLDHRADAPLTAEEARLLAFE